MQLLKRKMKTELYDWYQNHYGCGINAHWEATIEKTKVKVGESQFR